jgi:hypothetical protein
MSNGFFINDEKWAEELERGVESYTDMLFEAIYEGTEEEISETVSGEPFCGCNRCFWRETMFYLVPKLLKGHQEGKIELEE